jgi:flagellar assembly factor FliW
MPQFIVINPAAEVNGKIIMSVVKGMHGFESTALMILEKVGITNSRDDSRYSQQACLNAF